MSCYENGKIYKLWSNQTDLVYIGSTCNPLHKRFYQHKNHYKNIKQYITAFELLKYEDCKIELIETYSCKSKEELNAREGYWIRKENCVNKCVAGRGKKEYQEEHKEKIKKYGKEYREENKEYLQNYFKEYQEEHKEEIKEKRNKKIDCECGGFFSLYNKARHLKSKKHEDYCLQIGHSSFSHSL